MKGFKKDGKFRPTEKRRKSALKKEDIKHQFHDDRIGKTLPLTRKKEYVESDSGETPPNFVYDKEMLTKHDGRYFLIADSSMGLSVDEYKKLKNGKFEHFSNITFVGAGEDKQDLFDITGGREKEIIAGFEFETLNEKKFLEGLDSAGALDEGSKEEYPYYEKSRDKESMDDDYVTTEQIYHDADDYLKELIKENKGISKHDQEKAVASYLIGSYAGNPNDESEMHIIANDLVFHEENAEMEADMKKDWEEEQKWLKEEGYSSIEEAHDDYLKKHPEEARQKKTLDRKHTYPNVLNHMSADEIQDVREKLEREVFDDAVTQARIDVHSNPKKYNLTKDDIERVELGYSGSLDYESRMDDAIAENVVKMVDEALPTALEDSKRHKKTIQVNQTEGQKHRAEKAIKEGTHHHEGFTNLTKKIKKNDPSLSDESAKKIAGSIQAKSKKKFGSKTVSKGGKKHVEPAI